MTVPLVHWDVPDGLETIITWLSPLGETRDVRPTGAVLPCRMVQGGDGPFDGLVHKGVYTVHTFAETKPAARAEATLTQRRMEYLVSLYACQQKVIISGGREVMADNVVTVQYPHPVQWLPDDSLHQYLAEYRVDLRIAAA